MDRVSPPEVSTAVTTASTIAPPTCPEVFSRPEASPCSSSCTPLVAWMFSEGNDSAKAMPSRTMPGITMPPRLGVRSMPRKIAYPPASAAAPMTISLPVPNRSAKSPILVEVTATSTPAGRNAMAVPRADQPSRFWKYCMATNWNDTYEPMRMSSPRLARTMWPERRMPSRTSGCRTLSSVTTNSASSAATPASEPIVRREAQPASGACTTVKTSSNIDAVMVTAPTRS